MTNKPAMRPKVRTSSARRSVKRHGVQPHGKPRKFRLADTKSSGTLSSSSALPSSARMSSSPWLLLRGREFRRYFLSSLASNTGSWLQSTAQVVLAFQFTHSVAYVGLIVALQFAGVPLLSPAAAVLTTRFNRRRVLLATQVGSAAVAMAMAGCYALGKLGPYPLAVGALLLGVGYSLGLPLQVTLVPALVRPQDSDAALRMNSVSYNSGRALAPALSVLIIATIGAGYVFALNALSFLVFAAAISRLRIRSSGLPPDSPTEPIRQRARILDGARIAFGQQRILLLMAIIAAVTLADDPIQVLSPALRSAMHLPHDWTGLFIAALGWGAVAGSFWPRKTSDPGDIKAAQKASKTAALWLLVLSASVLLYAAGLSPTLSLAGAIIAGIAALFTGTAAQTPIVVRDHRAAASVGALWAIAWAGTKPVASLLDGWLAGRYGIVRTAIFLVLPALVIGLCELSLPSSWKRFIKRCAANIRFVKEFGIPARQA